MNLTHLPKDFKLSDDQMHEQKTFEHVLFLARSFLPNMTPFDLSRLSNALGRLGRWYSPFLSENNGVKEEIVGILGLVRDRVNAETETFCAKDIENILGGLKLNEIFLSTREYDNWFYVVMESPETLTKMNLK